MQESKVRGVRGAITVEQNTAVEITKATQELLTSIIKENKISIDDICSVFFTITKDLNAQFPARAAREMGWQDVPLLCAQELDVPGSLSRCIRVLLHINTSQSQQEIEHVYLREAKKLRPDLTNE
ncbi:MAG: chorismate mutase [Firmicutes bacterium]|nr:chorismate mutase [Bacillota bacterium]